MSKINQMCILAGGKGKRLMPYTALKPKILINVAGKPFLELLIDQALKSGIKKILILAGYKGKILKQYVEKIKIKRKINIEIIINKVNLSTIQRLSVNKNKLDDHFILNYSDSYIFFNLRNYLKKNIRGINFLLKNANKTNENGNIKLQNKKIISYSKDKNDNQHQYLELGYMLINKSILDKSYKEMSHLFNDVIKSRRATFDITNGKYLSITDIISVKKTTKILLKKNEK